MSRLQDKKYDEIVREQAQEFNKRASWVGEMLNNPQYPSFEINMVNSKEFERTIDTRDIKAMSSLLPLRGNTEEEIKKNFQDDVFEMYNALVNGPIEKTGEYLDKLIDIEMNFDESKLDFTKKEDVFKAISVASLGQCFGTKHREFMHYYNTRLNSKKLKEEYYYKNIKFKNVINTMFGEIEKRQKLDITVTIFGVDFSFDKTYDTNAAALLERDLKQVENILQEKDEVVGLNYVVNEDYMFSNNPNTTIAQICGNMAVICGTDLIFQDIILPGGTEGKAELETYLFSYKECVFINGKPISEAVKGTRFDVQKEGEGRRTGAFLAQQLTDPTSVIEVCKLVPIGEGKFKQQFIPLHKDFSRIDPNLQAQYDEIHNQYVQEGYKAHRENEIKFINNAIDTIKTKEAKALLEKANKIPDPQRDGSKPTYNSYDPFFKDDEKTKNALNRIEHVFNVGHKFPNIVDKEDLKNMTSIEKRQGLGMALIMAGKNPTDEDIYKKRMEVMQAYKANGEFKREYNRQLINKVLEYDFTKDITTEDDLYEYMVYTLGATAVSNILEEDPELEAEYTADPITKNLLSIKTAYPNSVGGFIGGKVIEYMGGVAHNTFSVHPFDGLKYTDAATLGVLEAKRIVFDVTNAKVNALFKDETEHKLRVPYFLAGDPCGSTGAKFSMDQANLTVDDYLEYFRPEGNDLISVSENIVDMDGNQADTGLLAVGTGNALSNALAYSLQENSKDNTAEFIKANGLNNEKMTELCTYINGTSLKDLIDAKINDVIASKNLNPQEMNARDNKHLRDAINNCILAEAMANPSKNISVVYLKSNENNELSAKTILLKKDYTPMVKQANKQHTIGERILHFFHIKKYDEERVVEISKEAVRNYNETNQTNDIAEKFINTNKELLLKHQEKYAVTEALREHASNILKSHDKIIRNVREQFLNDKVEVKNLEEKDPLNRPNIGKISSVTRSVDEPNSKSADKVETENFNKKYIKQVAIDMPKENEEDEKDFDEIPSSPEQELDVIQEGLDGLE